MLTFVMLIVFMLSVIILSFVMLSVVMLSVFRLNCLTCYGYALVKYDECIMHSVDKPSIIMFTVIILECHYT
jgi:hypothetical protein